MYRPLAVRSDTELTGSPSAIALLNPLPLRLDFAMNEGFGLQTRGNSASEKSINPITQESRSPIPGRVSDERQRQEVAE